MGFVIIFIAVFCGARLIAHAHVICLVLLSSQILHRLILLARALECLKPCQPPPPPMHAHIEKCDVQ